MANFISAVVTTSLIALAIAGALDEDARVAAALALFSLLCAVVLFIGRRRAPALALAVILILVMNALGFAYDLFDAVAGYDEVAHGVTLLVVAVLLRRVTPSDVASAHPRFATFVAAGATLGLGAVWDIAEWTASAVFDGYQIKGLNDTITDLIYGGAGGAVGAVLQQLVAQRSSGAVARTA